MARWAARTWRSVTEHIRSVRCHRSEYFIWVPASWMGRAHLGAYQVGYRQIGRRLRTGPRGPRAAELSACIIGLRNPLTPSFVSEVLLENEIDASTPHQSTY